VRGESAVSTGLLLAPQGVGTTIAMWLSGRLVERYGGGRVALAGGTISVIATVPFVIVGGHTSMFALCAAMIFRGFGMGMTMMPSMTSAYRVLRPDQINDASPQLNVLQRVGGSLGVALVTVVLESHLIRAGASTSAQAASFGATYAWVLGLTAVATLPALLLMRLEHQALASGRVTELPEQPVIEAA
jgi:MFS family permease